MSENNEKKQEETKKVTKESSEEKLSKKEEFNIEDKLKNTEDKLLRSLAEIENQRRRFEKDIKDAFDFGS